MSEPRDRTNRIRRRRFALTLNNPTAVDCVRWNSVILDGREAEHAENLTFLVVQTEKGNGEGDSPSDVNGTVHYQAYCEFKKQVEWSTVKKIFGTRVHIENARAGSSANIRYCTKNDTRFTGGAVCINGQWGTPRKGGGTTMAAIKILNGASLETIVEEHPDLALLHLGKLEGFIAYAKGPRTTIPKIVILFGLTGCGKSQHCLKKYGVRDAFWLSPPQGGRVW